MSAADLLDLALSAQLAQCGDVWRSRARLGVLDDLRLDVA